MVKVFSVLILLVLAGCAGAAYTGQQSACSTQGESSYDCQIYRYSMAP